MLEMRAATAIRGYSGPLVAQDARLRFAEIHHGLNREHHAFAQFRAMSTGAEVRNLRLFVQFRPDSVPYKIANHAESGSFHVLLHCGSNIAHQIADAHLLDSAIPLS